MLMRVIPAAALLAVLASSPLLAGEPAQSVPATNTNVGPKDEKICENITPIGSRLATKRFCGTRAEWEDRKRQDREAIENAQRSPCMLTHNSGTGRPSC
ncbi:hypothetical protein GCM10023264_14240 [Sphingomonas daechungensis]|uniref:Secreted protein n=1 Tax=Sphingomonas daechungensis TaxID=1176646 RepID=A0ABX6T3M9_9SPHN|nr:hypothetical protein [Sphingomonas daechungensis]QNP44270.1 hypothetical protein H9L15_07400 [Sphingomonas daechungensis]